MFSKLKVNFNLIQFESKMNRPMWRWIDCHSKKLRKKATIQKWTLYIIWIDFEIHLHLLMLRTQKTEAKFHLWNDQNDCFFIHGNGISLLFDQQILIFFSFYRRINYVQVRKLHGKFEVQLQISLWKFINFTDITKNLSVVQVEKKK